MKGIINVYNGGITDLKQYLDQFYFDKSTAYKSRVLGILLITIGIISFYEPFHINVRIGITIILIGTLMLFLITEKSTPMGMDVKITLFLAAWVLVMFFISGRLLFEIFVILIFLGILIIKELTDEFITTYLKKRLTILISIFLLIYLIFIAERIISFFSI